MRRILHAMPVLLVLSAVAPTLAAPLYPIQILLRNGDDVTGVGLVTTIDNLSINNAAKWIVQVDTNNPDTNVDACLVRDGVVLVRENDPVPVPAGANISSFDGVSISGDGRFAGNLFLRNATTSTDSGVFLGDKLIIRESQISAAPEFSPNTPYIGFFEAKTNANGQVYIVASVDDPAIATTVDRALVIASTAGGELTGERVLAKEGDILPGQSEAVADFGTGPHLTAFNNREQILYFVDLTGDTLVDGAIYLDLTLIAQEGGPSPVAGRTYEVLSSRGLDVNNFGQVAFKANLSGDTTDDEMIVAEGEELIREKSTLSDIAPFLFTAFGTTSGPIAVDDLGNVLWFGDWDDPVTTVDTGLFLNDKLIVREGDALPGGGVLTAIASGEDSMAMSDDGRYIVFEGTVTEDAVARNAALMIDVTGPPPVPDGNRIPGTQMTAGRNANGVDIDLDWDVTTCPALTYNVFYGDLASVASYVYTGSSCDLGATGSATFSAPAGDLFFVVASQEGTIEGVHGFDSEGRARPLQAAGACGVSFQIRSAACP